MNNLITNVANKLSIDNNQVTIVLDLIKTGATVPFIARYRKSLTGGLDEEQIEKINYIYKYDFELNKRKEAIKSLLEETQLLTEEIKIAIDNTTSKSDLESIYEPYKVGKTTKASEAIKMGLEPLAKTIFNSTDEFFNPEEEAKKYLSPEVKDISFALEQASLILAQYISIDLKIRARVKKHIKLNALLQTKVKKGGKEIDIKGIFRNYYDSSEQISNIPNHRILAICRGENNKVLRVSLQYPKQNLEIALFESLSKSNSTKSIIESSLSDALKRLIYPSIEREIRKELFLTAEEAAIELFANNLEEMLLAPAVQDKVVMAIDPAFISGCKIAVLSKTGKVLEISIINPTPPRSDIEGSKIIVNNLIDKYNVQIVVIGNGTASRETELFIAKTLKEHKNEIPFAVVSEIGASVYSASKIAIEEFPDLSVEQRSAITIGRRFQDPLNELVKVDPKAIGVGQYQHDVNQKLLSEALSFKTHKVVNSVGVDINSATKEILSYVAGLSKNNAQNIIDYRKDNGEFKTRKEIKKVKGLGPKSFEQAIGFIRIHNSSEVLDKTPIHPESYKLAKSIIKELNIKFSSQDKEIIQNANVEDLAVNHNSNKYDIKLILDSLLSPGKDIRSDKEGLVLKTDVLNFVDIKQDMELEGTVQNITDFGAFIYIGIKEAALIHISQMSDKFIKHPSEVVKVGERVLIKIISVDDERKRIQAQLIK